MGVKILLILLGVVGLTAYRAVRESEDFDGRK